MQGWQMAVAAGALFFSAAVPTATLFWTLVTRDDQVKAEVTESVGLRIAELQAQIEDLEDDLASKVETARMDNRAIRNDFRAADRQFSQELVRVEAAQKQLERETAALSAVADDRKVIIDRLLQGLFSNGAAQ